MSNNRLRGIFRSVLNEPDLELTDDMTADDVEGWDSLSHVRLIIAVEAEYGIRFSASQVSQMDNVADLKRLIDANVKAGK
jgi:acyl carrier protein